MCFNLNRARTCTHPRECNRPFGTRSTVGTTAAAPLRWGRARNGTRRLLSIRLFGTRSKARRNEATIRTRPRHRHPRCARNGKRPRGCTRLSGTRNTRGRLRLRRLRRRRRLRLRCAKPALVASGALAFLEGVADRARAWAFSEPSLLRVLALSAPRGLVLPPLALVELLFAAGEDELGVAIAAVQSDVLPLLRQRVGVRGAFGVDLEPVLFVAVLGGFLWGYNVWGVEGTGLGWVYIGCIFLRALQ